MLQINRSVLIAHFHKRPGPGESGSGAGVGGEDQTSIHSVPQLLKFGSLFTRIASFPFDDMALFDYNIVTFQGLRTCSLAEFPAQPPKA